MSFFIKGKTRPSTCSECPCCYNYECFDATHHFCTAKDNTPNFSGISAGTLPDCPIIRIPEKHGALIDKDCLLDHLLESIEKTKANDEQLSITDIVSIVKSAPTIIEAEYVE